VVTGGCFKKGATEFDFDKLIPRLNTVKVATWVVKALKIDVSSHLLTRELARKVSIDNLEFLFDQGIGSFTIFDWLERCANECCTPARGLPMIQNILD
jgi:hypothetical protein